MLELERLANPVFHALNGPHGHFAHRGSSLLRYQPDVLPFAAVPEAGTPVHADEATQHGNVFFCDAIPSITGNAATQSFRVAQMIYRGDRPTTAEHPAEVKLTLANADEMVELTDVAFPGFFRIETVRLGRYLGIRQDGILVAMAGERFRLPGLRELSAVCTRPGYTGQGLAAHLISRLLSDESGETPFLHVTESNARAVALYQRLNFEHVRTVDVMKVERTAMY